MDVRQVINEIAENAERNAKGRKEHLNGFDGLLHCDICGDAVQTRVELFGEIKTVRCICQCDKARLAAEKAQAEQAELARRIQQYRADGFDRAEMGRWTFDTDDHKQPQLLRAMRAYADGFDDFKAAGKGLLLYGSVGSGKTFAAACVANALIDKGIPVLMTNFSRIINRIQASFDGRQEYIDSITAYPLLIIDDLAAERNTEFVNEVVFSVIDARYRTGLPLIITTNIDHETMMNETDIARRRIYSRIIERCHPIKVSGADRRAKAAVADFAEMQKRLGL